MFLAIVSSAVSRPMLSRKRWSFLLFGGMRRRRRADRPIARRTDAEAQGGLAVAVTYFVALPFIQTDEGIAPGQAKECLSEGAAIRRAESMSCDPENVGALAFKRSGDLSLGNFSDAVILRSFGVVPTQLDEL
jgi:hypothetical protein